MKHRLIVLALVLFLPACASIARIEPCVRYLIEGTIAQHPECPQIGASPSPAASPTPAPPPSTTTTTTTTSTTTTTTLVVPAPSPSPGYDGCPAPVDVKLGFGQNPRALNPGYRNTAGITPLVKGACRHKGDFSPDAICAADEGCADHVGSPYEVRYGQPEAWQTGPGFTRDPVERSTDGCVVTIAGVDHVPCGYNLAFSTSSPNLWRDGMYIQNGPMEICASMPNLTYWRCQAGRMGTDGKFQGFGQNDSGYNKAK